jgi:hypothetical protein
VTVLAGGGACGARVALGGTRRDETCPVSTGRGTRRVQLVREGGGGGGPEHLHGLVEEPLVQQERDERVEKLDGRRPVVVPHLAHRLVRFSAQDTFHNTAQHT